MLLITAWSYSRWATYTQCPYLFKLRYIDKLPEPESPAMARGQRIHKRIAEYLTGATDTIPDEAARHAATFLAEVRALPDKLVEHQQGFDNQWRPCAWFGKTTWYRQVYDVAVLYEDMRAEVVDWKTGKKYSTNEDQMELCALSLMCQFKPATHVTTRLYYLDAGQQEFAEFPASEREALKAKWNDKVAPLFADPTFAPRPNDKCRFCAFNKGAGGPCQFG